MSVMLVTLVQAKARLRIDDDSSGGSDQDDDLELMIQGASRAVLNYIAPSDPDFLDTYGEPLLDTAGQPIGIPSDVQTATLLLVGDLFKNRDGANQSEYEHGFLPRAVLCWLYPYRRPTLA